MKTKEAKSEILMFRASNDTVESLNKLAELAGVNRSEMLRRCIPDIKARQERKNNE